MSARFKYGCTGCDYEIHVAGGISIGIDVGRDTMVCNSCKNLVDVVIRHIEPRNLQRSKEHKEAPFTCPLCKSGSVAQWNHRRPCPKCGKEMKQIQGHVIWG
jgi:Zn finger protein HypA/HybF involved in hydrogenase expression